MKKILFIFILFLCLSGCTLGNAETSIPNEIIPTTKDENTTPNVTTPEVTTPEVTTPNETLSNEYLIGDFKITTNILNGFTFDENVINFTEPGEYIVSGSFNGSLIFSENILGSVELYLDNAHITGSTLPAIYWKKDSGKIEIKAMAETINTITQSSNPALLNAAIESENNIELGGSGSLTISGLQKHAVKGSNITVKGNVKLDISAVSDGFHAKHVLFTGGFSVFHHCSDAVQAEVNKNNQKGTILIEAGTIIIKNTNTAFQADTSLKSIAKIDLETNLPVSIIISITSVDGTFKTPIYEFDSNTTVTLDGVSIK